MATILPQAINKGNVKLHAIKVDMTPMVDLGFLLITFFIFTTSMMEPHTTKLTMPKEGGDTPAMPVFKKTMLTAILDQNKVTVYEGAWEDALAANAVKQTTYNMQTGLGNSVRQKQKTLETEGMKDDMMVVIKPLASASYQNVLNALDEMQINGVKRYAIIDASAEEKLFTQKNN